MEGYKCRQDEGEVRRYWMTLRNWQDAGNWSTTSHCMDKSLWKRLCTCHKTDYRMNKWMNSCHQQLGHLFAKTWETYLPSVPLLECFAVDSMDENISSHRQIVSDLHCLRILQSVTRWYVTLSCLHSVWNLNDPASSENTRTVGYITV